MRVMDLDGPGDASEGVCVMTARNGIVYRVDGGNVNDRSIGELWTADWESVAICPELPPKDLPPATESTKVQPIEREIDWKWEQLKDLFADDPLILPSLLKIEKIAGKAQPRLWFACACYWLATSTHDHEYIQKMMIDMIAEASRKQRSRLEA
jgi:hypothetical protein